MADDIADDVKPEITLEDFNADEQQPAKAEPSPVAKDAPASEDKTEAKDTKVEATDTVAPPDVPTKTETESPKKADETETEDKPTKAEDRKTQLNSEIRDLVAQRNTLREEVEKANSEVYQPASVDDLKEQGMTDLEAKVEAMRQQGEMDKYNNQVAEAQLTIGHESQRVLQDFPIFNPDDESYDKELAGEAAELLQANLVVDENSKQVIGTNPGFSVYNIYKTLARASGISGVKGQIRGQADSEKQLANVDANSSAAPPKAKVDPLKELWESDD